MRKQAQKKTEAAAADESAVALINQGNDGEVENVTQLDVAKFAIKDGDETFTLKDVAAEMLDLQQRSDHIKARADNVSKHMVAIAAKCGQSATFKALCMMVEESNHWGRVPKGTPKHIAKLYQSMPKIWQQYKSKILASMDAGIKPMGKTTFTRKLAKPDAEGNKEVKEQVTLDSVHYLDKARREVVAKEQQKVAAAKEQQKEAPKAGIIVGKDGKEHRQPIPDMKLGTLLADIANLYEKQSAAKQKEYAKQLQAIIKSMEETATIEAVEQEAAAS